MSWQPPGVSEPSDTATWSAGTDVLATAPLDEPARRAPWFVVAGVAALVLALVGGVTYGFTALSGGGSQPEDALPAGAFGFVKIDLDPSAGQKIDGFRFVRKFPALRDRLGSGDDLRKLAFETVADGAGWSEVDFDADVAPWMGKRIAVAAYPPEKADSPVPDPTVVVALQVEDQGAAEVGLRKLSDLEARSGAPGAGGIGFVVTGDYALLAETQALADRAAKEAAAGALGADETLSGDLAPLGDGVVSLWVDMDRAVRSMGVAGLGVGSVPGMVGSVGGLGGRSAYVARFDGPDVFEVRGRVTDADTAGWATHAVEGVEELPESSVLALGLADGDELVKRLYEALRTAYASAEGAAQGPSFDAMVAEAESSFGLEIPEDVAALLGDNLLLAVDGGGSEMLQVGARVRTDVTRAERVLDLLAARTGGFELARARAGDDLVVASTPAQAGRLAETGTLGDHPAFGDALPDLADADLAVWLDPKRLSGMFAPGGDPSDVDENLEPIDGMGLTASSRDEGNGTFRFRVVAR